MSRAHAKRSAGAITRCIFCNRPDLRREHVWPIWTHEFIGKKSGPQRYVQKLFSTSPARRHIRGERWSKETAGDVTTIKLKVVCNTHCNSGWMSRLESRVKPILQPLISGHGTIELNKYNQEVLATWIATKFQVCEFSVPEDVVTPAVERSLLMGRQRPSDIMAIWIGRYLSPNRSNGYLKHAATLGWAPFDTRPKMPPQGSFVKNTEAQSLAIGELFIHSITTTVPNLTFNMPAYAASAMKQIWPFQHTFTWPPFFPVSDPVLAAITTDFDRFTSRLPHAPGTTHK